MSNIKKVGTSLTRSLVSKPRNKGCKVYSDPLDQASTALGIEEE